MSCPFARPHPLPLRLAISAVGALPWKFLESNCGSVRRSSWPSQHEDLRVVSPAGVVLGVFYFTRQAASVFARPCRPPRLVAGAARRDAPARSSARPRRGASSRPSAERTPGLPCYRSRDDLRCSRQHPSSVRSNDETTASSTAGAVTNSIGQNISTGAAFERRQNTPQAAAIGRANATLLPRLPLGSGQTGTKKQARGADPCS